jgi:hypothetical protein
MAALRLAFGLFFSTIALLGYMAVDYTMANRAIVATGAEPIGFFTYVKGWTGLAEVLARGEVEGDGAAAPPSSTLLAMLPKPPAGWTLRPTEETDGQPFLTAALGENERALVLSAVTPETGKGVDRAAQTYQNGAQSVVVELIRYPDIIFTSIAAMTQKMQLQMASLDVPGKEFMVVRGLDVREARLGTAAAARVFLADVGGQIHLRVLAPATMTDQELLGFFETLHVPAMNADVVEKVAGLGEVPVIVLASVIDAETRKAREVERTAAREAAEAEAEAKAADAEASPAAGAGESGAPASEDPGVTVRKGLEDQKKGKSTLPGQSGGFGLDGACRTEGGRKICGSTGG